MSEIPRNNPDEEQPVYEIPEAQTELTPEVLEKVMAKVRDIDELGNGYSMLRGTQTSEDIEPILKDGLLGTPVKKENVLRKGNTARNSLKEEWASNARTKKDAVVFFNITGRSEEKQARSGSGDKYLPTEISASEYVWGGRDNLGILFDISHFEEGEPGENKFGKNGQELAQKSGRYRADRLEMSTDKYKKWKERDFYPSPGRAVSTEYGYILSHRVAPRFFTGILINPKTKVIGSIEIEYRKRDRQELVELAREIAARMLQVDSDKPDLLIPIYDTDGNLLWPKQINHIDMRKFIAGRDKEKQGEK